VAAAAVWLLPTAGPLAGQTVGTLEVGLSAIQYDGFLWSGAAVLAPALRYDSPAVAAGLQGTWVMFESGNQVLQGTAAAAWLSPLVSGFRVEMSGSLGVSQYADAGTIGHALATTRFHLQGARAGGWASGTTGASWGENAYTPLELSLGAWHVGDRFAVVGTGTLSTIGAVSYVDLVGAARWMTPRLQVDAQVGARPFTDAGSTAGDPRPGLYGELSLAAPLGTRFQLTAAAGSYPTDPIRGVLGATYVTAGLQMDLFGPRVRERPVVTSAVSRAGSLLRESGDASEARLSVSAALFRTTLTIQLSGATLVEVMGDFTDWEPVALTRVGADRWEVPISVEPGVYRLNVRINGGPWQVPRGTRLELNEFGGSVGVLIIR
jgi:hypothetical protein